MTRLQTQTKKYWVDAFAVEQDDIEWLYNVLLEKEKPLSIDEMTLVLVRHRISEEKDAEVKASKPENIYQPATVYEVGDVLSFDSMAYAEGEVLEIRPGNNPEYGDFSVLSVKVEGYGTYEFASGITSEHITQVEEDEEPEPVDTSLMTPEDIFIEYGGDVADVLDAVLQEHEDIVRLAGQWFPRSLLADVNVGHLNLSEAILDMGGGGPLSTVDILEQIGMMDGINPDLAEFSMNYGLQQDDRFDEVGSAGKVLWFLKRMEPEEVQNPPARLAYHQLDDEPLSLTDELNVLEHEIGDEHSDLTRKRGKRPQSVTVTLTYPHRRVGTLPLSFELRRMFPTAYQAPRIHFTLIDADSKEEIPAWVVRKEGFVYGLADWIAKHEIPVGGYLTITRTDDPGTVMLDYARRKPRKEWVRTAYVENNRLRFENRQRQIGADYDDLMIIDVSDQEEIDGVWQDASKSRANLESIIRDICRELISSDQQPHVHAKTIYSAVNVIRRCPPGPIFATLISSPEFVNTGGPYWGLRGDQGGGE